RSAAIGAEAWAVPRPILVVGLLLVLGTILAWPAFKLRLMGPRERLELWDVRLLVVSAVVAVMVVTLVVGTIVAYLDLGEHLDGVARRFAADFMSRLHGELCDIALQSVQLPNPQAGRARYCGSIMLNDPRITDVARASGDGTVEVSCGKRGEGSAFQEPDNPPKSVGDRQYFHDVRDSRLWRLACPDGMNPRVAVESVRTRTRGEASLA